MDIDAILTMMEAETTAATKVWMGWMVLMLSLSVVFVAKYKTGRWGLATAMATLIGATLVWALTQNVHLFALPHIIVWPWLAAYFWRSTLSASARAANPPPHGVYAKAHVLWVALLFATILISLVFDVRDVYLVMTGGK